MALRRKCFDESCRTISWNIHRLIKPTGSELSAGISSLIKPTGSDREEHGRKGGELKRFHGLMTFPSTVKVKVYTIKRDEREREIE